MGKPARFQKLTDGSENCIIHVNKVFKSFQEKLFMNGMAIEVNCSDEKKTKKILPVTP